MRTIGNIIWFIFTGLWSSLAYFFTGLLLCIFIVTIPFGLQCFKIAGLVAWPFGKNVHSNFGRHPIMNILWCVLFGWEIAVGFLASGCLYCLTIVGIPFGLQCFKLAQLSFVPFGALSI